MFLLSKFVINLFLMFKLILAGSSVTRFLSNCISQKSFTELATLNVNLFFFVTTTNGFCSLLWKLMLSFFSSLNLPLTEFELGLTI